MSVKLHWPFRFLLWFFILRRLIFSRQKWVVTIKRNLFVLFFDLKLVLVKQTIFIVSLFFYMGNWLHKLIIKLPKVLLQSFLIDLNKLVWILAVEVYSYFFLERIWALEGSWILKVTQKDLVALIIFFCKIRMRNEFLPRKPFLNVKLKTSIQEIKPIKR